LRSRAYDLQFDWLKIRAGSIDTTTSQLDILETIRLQLKAEVELLTCSRMSIEIKYLSCGVPIKDC